MTQRKLPKFPYLGLAQYEAEQSLLFAGREDQVHACAEIVAQSDTRILMLHGQTGCGKSSFLRAGLIPALEDGGFGYVFVRKPPISPEEEGSPVFIRCGKDPLESLARDLYHYISAPVVLRTALGPRPFDLSAAKLDCADVAEFIKKCRDPERVLDVLSLISAPLVHSLVVVMDQMEEVLTLNQADSDNRTRFFTFLKLFNNTNHHVKLILSLRKDHSGEFLGLAQLDNTARAEFKVYLLPDMTRDEVLSAIVLPTLDEKFSDDEPPSAKYRFHYAPGIAELIVNELFASLPRGGVLPVMQIVCRDLYDSVRKGPEPWVITEALYKKNRIEGSIRQHVANSLRKPLRALNLSESSTLEEEQRWRKVLFALIRYEGDGRVSTDFMSREALQEKARKERVSCFDEMLDHLAKPEVLVLRSINVPGARHDKGATMFGLGHDVVGLALHAFKIEDEAVEQAEKRRRRWRIVSSSVTALVVVILLGVVALKVNEQQKQLRKNVSDALASAKSVYSEDATAALAAVNRAIVLSSDLYFGSDDTQLAERIAAQLNAALPFANLPLSSTGGSDGTQLHGLLESTPGVISVNSTGEISVHRLDAAAAHFVPGAGLRVPGSFQLSRNAYLSASEPDQGHILLLISSFDAGPREGDRDFRMFLIRENEKQVNGPYGGSELLTKFKVIRHRDTPEHKLDWRQPALSGVSLAGDVVTLTARIGDRNFVVSLLANPHASTDYFAPAVDLPMEVPRLDVIEMAVPEASNQLIVGGRLFSAHYPTTKQQVVLPKGTLDVLQGVPLRGGNQISTRKSNAWELRVAEIPAVAKCNQERFGCKVELLPPSEGRLQVLSLTSYETELDGPKAKGSSYIVIDSDSGKYTQVAGEAIERARKGCELFADTAGTEPKPAAVAPAFELGTLDDMLFTYPNKSAIQFVRIHKGQASCTERLLPDAERRQVYPGPPSFNPRERALVWRFLPDQNLVLALNSQRAMAWRLSSVSAMPKSSLQQANTATLDAR